MPTGYKTKQKDAIIDFFAAHEGEHMTAADVVAYLRGAGAAVAASTVYRCLERLENEGVLRKYIIDETSAACWQYVREHEGCENHFHLKCTRCARLIHADCDFLEEMGEHIAAHHGFVVDGRKTVLYGLCADCSTANSESGAK
jgi:Fur family ferric uptake transcriptional regulator